MTQSGRIKRKSCLGRASGASRRSPMFHEKLEHLGHRLAPLVQLTTGQVHARFPANLLSFWLLTEDELESLADFYHQRTPSEWSAQYPCPITWHSGLSIEEKRRKIGKFIGLRGCETPVHFKSEDELVAEARKQQLEDDALRSKLPHF